MLRDRSGPIGRPLKGFIVHQHQYRVLGDPDVAFYDKRLPTEVIFKGFDRVFRETRGRTAPMCTYQWVAFFAVSEESVKVFKGSKVYAVCITEFTAAHVRGDTGPEQGGGNEKKDE